MSRPPLEVADLIRSAGATFIERNRQWIRWQHVKVLLAIARCRTAALGGHVDQCTRCGHRATISYNSCRNRHCPKCQTAARDRWIAARQKELLPTRYVHVVFTLPAPLAPLASQNKKLIYGLLLRASAETLLEVASDPRHLGAEIGFFNITKHPTSSWIVQQLREAFPFGSAPRFVIFDRDAKYGLEVPAAVRALMVNPVRTSFESPWQNGVAERWVGSCRRDLLDHIIAVDERHQETPAF